MVPMDNKLSALEETAQSPLTEVKDSPKNSVVNSVVSTLAKKENLVVTTLAKKENSVEITVLMETVLMWRKMPNSEEIRELAGAVDAARMLCNGPSGPCSIENTN